MHFFYNFQTCFLRDAPMLGISAPWHAHCVDLQAIGVQIRWSATNWQLLPTNPCLEEQHPRGPNKLVDWNYYAFQDLCENDAGKKHLWEM